MADTKSEQDRGLQQPQLSPDTGTGSQPTHLDLFSGIGGFALAAQGAGFRTVAFVELDKYCQKVLAKNFPGVPIIPDIFDLLCVLKNNKQLHCETSPFATRSNSVAESQDGVSTVVQPDFFHEVSQNEGGDSVHGNAGQSPCVATTVQTQAAANGCTGEPTQTGNMGTDIQFVTLSDSLNGEGACSHGIATSASDASSQRKAKGNSTRTTSNRGHNFQSTDLKLVTDLLYASHATRGFTTDLLTAGFPCQPYSVAGLRRGKDDDRALWPALFEIIGLLRPVVCLLENVPGIIPMELDNVLSDLEGIGYATRAFVIPACAVDARHRRDRVWIVGRLADAASTGLEGATGASLQGRILRSSVNGDVSDSERGGQSGQGQSINAEYPEASSNRKATEPVDGGQPCIWFAEPDVGRVAHGVSKRVDRLKGLGNAIVPQVAYEILREIRKLI